MIDQFAEEYLLDDLRWTRAEYASQVAAVIDEVRLKYPVDDSAILLTGASMGGYGTWDLASRCPGRFAAAAPVSGGGDPLRARSLARLPFFVAHGAHDGSSPSSGRSR